MTLVDKYGNRLEITDLQKAIEQAEDFAHYQHEDQQFSNLDKERQTYWRDLYEKLLQLQQRHSVGSKKTANDST